MDNGEQGKEGGGIARKSIGVSCPNITDVGELGTRTFWNGLSVHIGGQEVRFYDLVDYFEKYNKQEGMKLLLLRLLTENDSYKKQLEKEKHDCEHYKKTCADKELDLVKAKKTIGALQRDVSEAASKLNELKYNNGSLKTKLSDEKKDVKKKEIKIIQIQQELNRAKEEVRKNVALLEVQKEKMNLLDQRVLDLTASEEEMNQKFDLLSEENHMLKASSLSAQDLQQKVMRQADQLRNVQGANSKLKHKIHYLQEKIKALEEKQSETTTELEGRFSFWGGVDATQGAPKSPLGFNEVTKVIFGPNHKG